VDMAVTNYFAEDEFGDVCDDDPGDEAVDVGAGDGAGVVEAVDVGAGGGAGVVEQEDPVEAVDVVAGGGAGVFGLRLGDTGAGDDYDCGDHV